MVLLCVGRDDPGAPDHAAFPSVILTVSPFVILRPQAEESASPVFVRNRKGKGREYGFFASLRMTAGGAVPHRADDSRPYALVRRPWGLPHT